VDGIAGYETESTATTRPRRTMRIMMEESAGPVWFFLFLPPGKRRLVGRRFRPLLRNRL
jgi:hypothetical protein